MAGPTFPWRSLRVLQFVIFTTNVNSVVTFRQFFLPISVFYVRYRLDLPLVQAAALAGLLVGPFFLGRSVGSWVWTALGKALGCRPIFSIAILLETVLTFLLAAFASVWVSGVIRALAGLFSPLSAMSCLVLRHFTRRFGEDLPLVAQTVTFMASAGQATGFLIGGCLAYPLQNELVDENSIFSGEPYLLPIMVVGVLQFVALLFFFLDFPDITISPEANPNSPKSPKEDSNMGKYAQLSESNPGNTDMQRSEGPILPSEAPDHVNPVTEREEKEVIENEDDLPGYLQCYELEGVEEVAETPAGAKSLRSAGNGSKRGTISPLGTTRIRDLKPNTSRGQVVAQIITREPPCPDNPSDMTKTHPLSRSDKTTHISFIEENFSSSLSLSCQSLDDCFKRQPNGSRVPLFLSLLHLCLSSFVASYMEIALAVWMSGLPQDGLSLLLVGVVLAGSVAGVWFLMWSFGLICGHFRLYHSEIVHCLGLFLSTLMPLLLTRWRPEGVAWVFSLIGLSFSTRYFSTFSCSFAHLLVSDSVPLQQRPKVTIPSEAAATLFKGLGYLTSPLLFALHPVHALNFLYASGLVALILLLTLCCKQHFPRFLTVPYAM